MEVRFKASFKRDIKRIQDQSVLDGIGQAIDNVKAADTLGAINSLSKLRGYKDFYRIRVGSYRLGLKIVDGEIIFVRVLPRKDIYRFFP
ncbi:MAG: type II toxin-antitoxin system RelE family toxin [Nodosilinea sp.]